MPPKKVESNGNGMKTISSFFKAKPNTTENGNSAAAAASSDNSNSTSTSTSASKTSTFTSNYSNKRSHSINQSSNPSSSSSSLDSQSVAKKQKLDQEEQLSRQERSNQWKFSSSSQPQSQRTSEEQKRHDAFRKQLLGNNSEVFSRGAVREITPEVVAGESSGGSGRRKSVSGKGTEWQDGIVIDSDASEDDQEESNLSRFTSQSISSKGKSKAKASTSSITKGKGKAKANGDGIKYTPLEKQILELKAKHPGVLLIIEVGYKFKFYGEDARIASRELNIMCFPERNLLSAMIPVHRINVHVKKLVSLGHKVGIVRQQETAALKAASSSSATPFIRELSSLYTSSTYVDGDVAIGLDEEFGNPAATNSMVALVERLAGGSGVDEFVTIGLVAVSTSTGEVIYDEWTDGMMRSELETRLAHLQPSELLLPQNLTKPTEKILKYLAGHSGVEKNKQNNVNGGSKSSSAQKIRIERIESVPSYNEAFSRITKFYESEEEGRDYHQLTGEDSKMLDSGELLTLAIGLPNLALQAMSCLITHLKSFQLSSVFKSTSNFQSFSKKNTMLLTSNTLSNLEIYHNSDDGKEKGSLVSLIDKCKTLMGKRLLRKWIGKPLTDLKSLEERRNALDEVKLGRGLVNVIPELLKGLPDLERVLAKVNYGRASPSELATMLLSFNRLTTIPEFETFERDEIGNGNGSLKSDLIRNCFSSFPKAKKIATEFYRAINVQISRENKKEDMFTDPNKYEKVQDVREQIAVVEHELNDHLIELRKVLKRPSLKYLEKSGIGYLVEVRVGDAKKTPSDWLRISATKDFVRFHTPTIIKLTKERARYVETLAIEANKAYLSFLQDISSHYVILRNVVSSIATLDVILSLSKVASFPNYTKPSFNDEGRISIKGMRHPVIEVMSLEPYVPNDVELGGENGQGLLITGSNMGGKSSTIRTIALIVLLAQIGSYVPADSVNIKLHDSILTRMGAGDDLSKGRSTFMVEMQETSEILKNSTKNSLVLIDELGRGTSTFDGTSIAFATLKYLLERKKEKRPTILFITHYLSLGEISESSNGKLKSMHMGYVDHSNEENEKGNGNGNDDLTFLYKLTPGLAKSSFGIYCAKLAGIPKGLLEIAQIKADEMELESKNRERKRWIKRSKQILETLKSGIEIENEKGLEIDEGGLKRLKELAGLEDEIDDDELRIVGEEQDVEMS